MRRKIKPLSTNDVVQTTDDQVETSPKIVDTPKVTTQDDQVTNSGKGRIVDPERRK
jgi:hypothetical protein